MELEKINKKIEKLSDNVIDINTTDELVNIIYNYIIENINVNTDTIRGKGASIIIENPKNKGVINSVKLPITGTYYDRKKVLGLLKTYIKKNKKNIYYIKDKEMKYRFIDPALLKTLQFYVKNSVSLAKNSNGKYTYKIKDVERKKEFVSQGSKNKLTTYISEADLKNIIKKAINEVVFTTFLKGAKVGLAMGSVASLGTGAYQTIISPKSFTVSENLYPFHHTIKKNENLSTIASKYNVTVKDILKYNPHIDNPDMIEVGDIIVIKYIDLENEEEINDFLSTLQNIEMTESYENNNEENKTTTQTEQTVSKYVIKRGDSLSSIASKFGTTLEELMALNGITNPNLIEPGQIIKVPSEEKLSLEQNLITHGYYKGIDISKWQSGIDLMKVYNENNINFVILNLHDFVSHKTRDTAYETYKEQIKEIKKIDPEFKVGVYFIPDLSVNEQELRTDMNILFETVNDLKRNGIEMDFPIYIDIEPFDSEKEEPGEIKDLHNIMSKLITADKEEMNKNGKVGITFQNAKLVVKMIKDYGEVPGIYTNIDALNNQGYKELAEYAKLNNEDFYWVADWISNGVHISNIHAPYEEYTMQQISVGRVNGYNGEIDVNSCSKNIPELVEGIKKGNPKEKEEEKQKEKDNKQEAKNKKAIISDFREKIKTSTFNMDDIIYENGLLKVDAGEININAFTDIDITLLDPGEAVEIEDITGQIYTIIKNDNVNGYDIIHAGIGIACITAAIYMGYRAIRPIRKSILINKKDKLLEKTQK